MRRKTFSQEYHGCKIRFTIKWKEWARDEDFEKLKSDFVNLINNVKKNKERYDLDFCNPPRGKICESDK